MAAGPDPQPEAAAHCTTKKRASQACHHCRVRKVKCDLVKSGVPCHNCNTDGIQCLVLESKRSRQYRLQKRQLVYTRCPKLLPQTQVAPSVKPSIGTALPHLPSENPQPLSRSPLRHGKLFSNSMLYVRTNICKARPSLPSLQTLLHTLPVHLHLCQTPVLPLRVHFCKPQLRLHQRTLQLLIMASHHLYSKLDASSKQTTWSF
jgi:hypothetical protein